MHWCNNGIVQWHIFECMSVNRLSTLKCYHRGLKDLNQIEICPENKTAKIRWWLYSLSQGLWFSCLDPSTKQRYLDLLITQFGIMQHSWNRELAKYYIHISQIIYSSCIFSPSQYFPLKYVSKTFLNFVLDFMENPTSEYQNQDIEQAVKKWWTFCSVKIFMFDTIHNWHESC